MASMNFTKDKFTLNVINEFIQFGLRLIEKPNPTTISLASAEVSTGPVKVKQEYFIYLKLYGVPAYGVFQQDLIDKIRLEYKL
jgi:hypothetical protein